jgi:hypothetical protein
VELDIAGGRLALAYDKSRDEAITLMGRIQAHLFSGRRHKLRVTSGEGGLVSPRVPCCGKGPERWRPVGVYRGIIPFPRIPA